MATWTRAQLIDEVLKHLGVLGAGQSASAEDSDLIGKAADSAHDKLNKSGLVPFALTAIPTYAQEELRDYIAGNTARSYGFSGQALAEFKAGQTSAERELAKQVAGYKHSVQIKTDYF